MEFVFFSATGDRLFVRSDAESAVHVHEEMSLQAVFPFATGREISRGQRIGYTDVLGVFRPFEVRKVRTYEPDHYQEITAEHIVISELSDEHLDQTEITDLTAAAALARILTGTLWSVGTNTASGTQTADISRGSVWQGVRSIEYNWNVYITPRVTFNAAGITGRYLDIAPAQPVWRGVRLSLEKNADEVGVTWDDTDVITAIYGYGGRRDDAIVTFKDVVWQATADHPAKPAGQAYLVDPDATALYGRDGRPRFGYYQNSNITDANVLLEKAWEALKVSMQPDVAVDALVRDLYRLGYADQPLVLHDLALFEIRPTGEMLRREIIRMAEDLLDPTATRVNIGAYIPNIVYMQRQTDRAARGGGGGGRRGGGGAGGAGQDNTIYEFETELQANRYQINLRAYQRDMTNVENILKEAGVAIDASGVIIYAGNNLDQMQSSITTNANKISLVVEGTGANASIKAASIVAAINDSGSEVIISADKIYLDGQTSIRSLLTGLAQIGSIDVGSLDVDVRFLYQNNAVTWQHTTVVTGVSITDASISLGNTHEYLFAASSSSFDIGGKESGRLVTSRTNGSHSVTYRTIHYLGQPVTTPS